MNTEYNNLLEQMRQHLTREGLMRMTWIDGQMFWDHCEVNGEEQYLAHHERKTQIESLINRYVEANKTTVIEGTTWTFPEGGPFADAAIGDIDTLETYWPRTKAGLDALYWEMNARYSERELTGHEGAIWPRLHELVFEIWEQGRITK